MASYEIMYFDFGRKLQKQEIKNDLIPSFGQMLIEDNKTYVVDSITHNGKKNIVIATERI